MKQIKKLNLNKYAFLNYLKGDVFAWLTCNENYQLAAQESKQLEKLTPWRFVDNDKDETEVREKRDDIPDQIISGIGIGKFAEEWAKGSYPKHKVATINKITNLENVAYTKQFLESEDDYIIFEATFGYNNFFIRTDILIKTGDTYKVVEVKAVSVPKEIHAWDLFFQKTLIEMINSNWKWQYTLLILDSMYVHNHKLTMLEKALKLFVETPIFLTLTAKPQKKNNISWTIQEQMLYAGFGYGELSEDANITKKGWNSFQDFFDDIERIQYVNNFNKILEKIKNIQLLDKAPITGLEKRNWDFLKSDYMPWVLKINGVEEKDSIFDIKNFKISNKLELFNNKNIKTIQETPISIITPKYMNVDSNDEQNTQKYINLFLKSKPRELKYKTLIQKHFVNLEESLLHTEGIKQELSKYKNGPIYMYDFETANLANPLIERTRPYQQVPYQFSVHIITDPTDFNWETGKNIFHKEWLVEKKEGFTKDFWVEFSNVFLEYGEGVYVSWNMSFEKSIIKEMDYDLLNDNQYNILMKVHDETVDLEETFKFKFYYHKDLHGSSSIKAVGPHFEPKINYKNLNNVQKGDQSSAQAKKWLRSNSIEGDIEWKNIRNDMLKYCKYDTLLMVAILQKLKNIKF
ncbi:MAG: DUF2779 domain-containing protein [Mycoplasmataceae bacterium]|nr:DUF2779 domain-containing protein [Mycoplasmataceae bacterium]